MEFTQRIIKDGVEYTLFESYVSYLDEKVEELQRYGKEQKKYMKFKGHIIYSDMTLDEAYLEIFGTTKEERDKREREAEALREKKEKEKREKAIAFIPDWQKAGEKFVAPEKLEFWNETVVASANSWCHGWDLEDMLEISNALIEGDLEKAVEIFKKQRHTGMSGSLVFSLLEEFIPEYSKEFLAINGILI